MCTLANFCVIKLRDRMIRASCTCSVWSMFESINFSTETLIHVFLTNLEWSLTWSYLRLQSKGDFTQDGMSRRHRFFLLLHMRKSFVYKHFPEMSIPLKSRIYFNFSAPNKRRFLFKPIIILEYSCKQSESLQHGFFTVHNI